MRNNIFLATVVSLSLLVASLSFGEDSYSSQTEKDLQALEQELLGAPMSSSTTPPSTELIPPTEEDLRINTSQEFIQAVENLIPLQDKEDLETFHRRLGALATPGARGIEIRVLKEAQKRPFSTLSAQEAAKSKKWYNHPVTVVAVQKEWVEYYTHTVAPKLDAFLRPLAAHVLETSGPCQLKREPNGKISVQLQTGPLSETCRDAPNGYSYYYVLTPEDTNEFDPEYKGDVVHFRYTLYCLPSAFAMRSDFKAQSAEVYWHVYDQNRQHLFTASSSQARSTASTWATTSSFECCWSIAWLLNGNIATPVLEGIFDDRDPFCIYLNNQQEYGGSLVSFRNAEECFPELKIKNDKYSDLKDPKPTTFIEGLFDNIPSTIFLILLIGSAPYMLVVLVMEYLKKYKELPLPEDYDREADAGAELRAEIQELISIRDNLPRIEQTEGGESLPVFNDRKEANNFTKLLAEAAALPDLTNAEKYELNLLGWLRNELFKRRICGSVRLLMVAIVYAIAIWYFFDSYAFIALPIYYLFTLQCPTYILAHGEPKLLTGIRNMLRGVAFVSSLFAANAASQRFVTVYTDGRGNFYSDSDEGLAHIGIALGILLMVLIFFPLLILIDGLCNFFRNYVLPK